MKDTNPLISVIMPVYNVVDYLAWSARSVLDQSYGRFELIMVDDGSTDGSGELADAIAKHDERIKVIHQNNKGLSGARNTAIRAVVGDVVIFLDSDDALLPEALETIAAAYAATGFDVLTFGAVLYPPSEASVWLTEIVSPRDVVYEGFEPEILFKERSHPIACRTAVRRALMEENGILFDEEVLFGEDQVFHFALYPRARKIVFIKDKLYLYRLKRGGSLTATRFIDVNKRAYEYIDLLDAIFKDWQDSGFLLQWPDELFMWSIDLMLSSLILNQGASNYLDILSQLRDVWRAYFSAEQLDAWRRDPVVGATVRGVLDGKSVSKAKMMLTLFNLRRRAYGLRFALRQALERPLARFSKNADSEDETSADLQSLQAAKETFYL